MTLFIYLYHIMTYYEGTREIKHVVNYFETSKILRLWLTGFKVTYSSSKRKVFVYTANSKVVFPNKRDVDGQRQPEINIATETGTMTDMEEIVNGHSKSGVFDYGELEEAVFRLLRQRSSIDR